MSFHHLKVVPRDDCPACHGKFEFLKRKFDIKTTSLCGQSRAIQVVDTRVKELALDKLASRLRWAGEVTYNEYMLHFAVDAYEIIVFPDGRAIIKNTIDESLAKELYFKYIGI